MKKNTIADANMLTLVIGAASEDIKEELEQNTAMRKTKLQRIIPRCMTS